MAAPDKTQDEFLRSLDLAEKELEAFIPYILSDLWELGSMPDYVIRLLRNHLGNSFTSIVDFGCGKGAVLIRLAQEFRFTGLGIDLMPAFIDAAREKAKSLGVDQALTFKTADIRDELKTIRRQDVIIYGHDSEVLGNVYESLMQLKECVKADGWIVLETCHSRDEMPVEGVPYRHELLGQLSRSGLKVCEELVWDPEELKQVNRHNNRHIQQRIDELITTYPAKAAMFREYMDNQLEECEILETKLVCATWLLAKE